MINLEKLKQQKPLKELLEFGIINIDKPSGPTSFSVSEIVMKKLGLRKTSHFGTLDPKVTGVLPIALNRACKLTGYFLGEDKVYVGIMRIHSEISTEELAKVIKTKFLGKIKQTPPVKSRVKRVEREREVKSFEILEKNGKDFLFKTHVQGGTYIRKLCDDLGKELGIGAHMLELRRTKAGIFDEGNKDYPSITLYELDKIINEIDKKDLANLDINTRSGGGVGISDSSVEKLKSIIIPGEIVAKLFPVVEIDNECVNRVLHGQPIYDKNLVKKEKLDKDKIISVFAKDRFIGMFKVVNEGKIYAKSEFTMQEIKPNPMPSKLGQHKEIK